MNNFDNGFYGLPCDLTENYDEYIRGKNAREGKSGDGVAIIFLFLAFLVIIALIPYAIISLVSAYFIFILLRKKFFLTYGNTYQATLLATVTFNILLGITFICCLAWFSNFKVTELSSLILPIIIFIIGLICTLFSTVFIFHRSIKKRINYSYSIRYTILLIIPINILFHLLPLIGVTIFLMHKFNISIPGIEELRQQISNTKLHIS